MSRYFFCISIISFVLFVAIAIYFVVLSFKNKELRERICKEVLTKTAIVFLGISTITCILIGSNSWSANTLKANVYNSNPFLTPNDLNQFVK